MDFTKLKSIIERKLSKCELDKREEIAQDIEKKQPNIDMSKKMAIATAAAKKSCSESKETSSKETSSKESIKKSQKKELSDAEKSYLLQLKESEDLKEQDLKEQDLQEISNYDKVVVYYRSLGMDPYKLKGEMGKQLRQKVKDSPAFKAWLKSKQYESVKSELDGEQELTEATYKDVVQKLKGMGFISRRDVRDHNKNRGTNHEIMILPGLEHPENSIAIPRHSNDIHPHLVKGIYKLATKLLSARQLNNKIVESKADKVVKAKKKKNEYINFYQKQQDYKPNESDFDPALTAQGNK